MLIHNHVGNNHTCNNFIGIDNNDYVQSSWLATRLTALDLFNVIRPHDCQVKAPLLENNMSA